MRIDPNDIIGPAGFGEEHWVSAQASLSYIIHFENLAAATAPVQQLVITQQLDLDLDPRTFRLDDFGWGGLYFDVPDNRSFYNERLDLTSDYGFFMDVSASIDVTTGLAFWTLTAIDPETGDQPENPLIGFLPPNDDSDRGEGFVSYTVKPKGTTVTGDVIDAQATIIFDTEEPLDTPPVFNTLDAEAPASAVAVLPAVTEATEFLVSWSGRDDEGGSAIAGYTIYVSDDGGAFTPWLTDTTRTESLFQAQAGHRYAFTSVARDNAGNVETAPTAPDASTRLTGGINQAPVLDPVGDRIINEKTELSFIIGAVDYDLPVQALTFSAADLPEGASLDPTTGLFSWTPAEVQGPGVYEVTFGVSDGALSDSETVYITVNEVNEAPVAVADFATTLPATPALIAVLANDLDPDGDPLTVAAFTQPRHGRVTDNGNGTLTYTPTTGFMGLDSFAYLCRDGKDGQNLGQVNLSVSYVPPTAKRRLPTSAPAPPASPPALEAAAAPTSAAADQTLTSAAVAFTATEALERWDAALGLPPATSTPVPVDIVIADLPGTLLGQALGNTVIIDVDAAGYGWFIDPTPADDSKFGAVASGQASPAAGAMDLLTVLSHELGHVLGFEHQEQGVMAATLQASERLTASAGNDSTGPAQAVWLFDEVKGELAPQILAGSRIELRSIKFDPALWQDAAEAHEDGEDDWIVDVRPKKPAA